MSKKKKTLSIKDFVQRAYNIAIEADKRANEIKLSAQKRIDALGQVYAKANCPKQHGDVVELPTATDDGYTSFTIDKIKPQIQPDHTGVQGRFEVVYIFTGMYKGEGKDDKPGTLKTKNHEHQEETPAVQHPAE